MHFNNCEPWSRSEALFIAVKAINSQHTKWNQDPKVIMKNITKLHNNASFQNSGDHYSFLFELVFPFDFSWLTSDSIWDKLPLVFRILTPLISLKGN